MNPSDKVVSSSFEPFPTEKIAAMEKRQVMNGDYIPPRRRMQADPAEAPVNAVPTNAGSAARGIAEEQAQPSVMPEVVNTQEVQETETVSLSDIQISLVPNPKLGATPPADHPSAISLDLPSRFAYYSFKDLFIEGFRLEHIGKFAVADSQGSVVPIVEALSSVMSSTSGEKMLAHKLTVPDFQFVLYYQRLNSFTKSMYIHRTTCTDHKHLEAVEQGKLKEDTLKLSQTIRNTSLVVRPLEEIPDPAEYVLSNGMKLRPPTMQDTIDISEHPAFGDADFFTIASAAVMLDFGAYVTLDQKMAVAKNLTPDDHELITQFSYYTENYGVDEIINITCPECGAVKRTKVQLTAHSFLPTAKAR